MSTLQLSIGLCFCSDATNVTSFNRLVLNGSCDIGQGVLYNSNLYRPS